MTNPSITPKWGGTTKLIVSLTLVAIVAGMLVKFQGILPPLIIMIIVAYLFNPIADFLSRKLHIGWKPAVTLVYFLALLLLLSLLTISGVGLVQQIQNMFAVIQDSLKNLPALFDQFSGREFMVGPFILDLRKVNFGVIGQQLIGSIEPLLGTTGGMVGTIAGGAANFFGWTMFVLLVSYFVLAESDGLWKGILQFSIPGYQQDIERMGRELAKIWNAFLRGQLIVMGMAAIVYSIALSLLGVSYALGLALLAGLARFVPYAGPFTLYVILAMVSYFQDFKLFGLQPWAYALIVIGTSIMIDGIADNFIMPRIMASTLKVHPAAVLVAAIIALGLLGILGVIIAAPMLATMQLVGRYFTRKLFDLDPWDGLDETTPLPSVRQQVINWFGALRSRLKIR